MLTQSAIVGIGIAVVSALATFVAGYAVVRERLRVLTDRVVALERRTARAERWIYVQTGKQAQIGPRHDDPDVIALAAWEESEKHE